MRNCSIFQVFHCYPWSNGSNHKLALLIRHVGRSCSRDYVFAVGLKRKQISIVFIVLPIINSVLQIRWQGRTHSSCITQLLFCQLSFRLLGVLSQLINVEIQITSFLKFNILTDKLNCQPLKEYRAGTEAKYYAYRFQLKAAQTREECELDSLDSKNWNAYLEVQQAHSFRGQMCQ